MGHWDNLLDKIYDWRGGNKKSSHEEIKRYSSTMVLYFGILAFLGFVIMPAFLEFGIFILFLATWCFISMRYADLIDNLKRRDADASR